MSKVVKTAILGCGSRGKDTFAPMSEEMSDRFEIVAVADIDPAKVQAMSERYNLSGEQCFTSAEAFLAVDKCADAVLIATQDRQHVPHALLALERGYDILLEKPISPDLAECRRLLAARAAAGREIVVCHVLRYTPLFRKVKELLDAGTIGEIVSMSALENVGWYHMAHSFVRGNWRNSDLASPMILQKCCHDMDLYLYLTGKKAERVSSFGSTFYFKAENAPEGAASRCVNAGACRARCPFDAEKLYFDHSRIGYNNGARSWPLDVVTLNVTADNLRKAIEEGPYGRCVFHCDNNVVDHQILAVQMTDGSTFSFAMEGLSGETARHARFYGTKGEMIVYMGSPENSKIEIQYFTGDQKIELIAAQNLAEDFSGHGGGDKQLMADFLEVINGNSSKPSGLTSLEQSMESHFLALAAEASRLRGGEIVSLDSVRQA